MHTPRLLRLALALLALAAAPLRAADDKAAPAAPTPAELAYAPLQALVEDKDARPRAKDLEKIADMTVAFVTQFPKDKTAGKAMAKATKDLLTRVNDPAARRTYLDLLQTKVAAALVTAPDDETKVGLMALDAAAAGGIMNEEFKKPNLITWREKIDAMAAVKGGNRFLCDREMEFVEALKRANPGTAERHLKLLVDSDDKKTAARALEELNYLEIRKTPYELAFTDLNGKPADIAKFRGKKLVYLYFWSSTSPALKEETAALRENRGFYSDALDVISVCCDTEEQRAQAVAAVASLKMKWPVRFEGTGLAPEYIAKLGLTADSLPTGFLFDRAGYLTNETKLTPSRLGKVLDKLVKKPKSD